MSEDLRTTLRDVHAGVLVPAGFERGDEIAFAHALRLTAAMKTSLTVLEASGADDERYGVREHLERWGMLPPGSGRSDVAKLGFWVRKARTKQRSARRAVLDHLSLSGTDLVVVASRGEGAFGRLLPSEASAPTAAESKAAVLFVPPDVPGFVDAQTGAARIATALIPVADEPPPESAVRIAGSLAGHVGADAGTFLLLHVGDGGAPTVEAPARDGWTCERLTRDGSAVAEIVAVARERRADVIVMTTEGRRGVLETLKGSTTERVLRESPCPVLALPA